MLKVSTATATANLFCMTLTLIEFLNTKGSFNVTGIDLMKEKNDQGYNVNATVSFKNPSPFIVEMVASSPPPNLKNRQIGEAWLKTNN